MEELQMLNRPSDKVEECLHFSIRHGDALLREMRLGCTEITDKDRFLRK